MSRDKRRRIVALLHVEAQRPATRSREVVARLRELAALYEHDCAPPRVLDRRIARALEALHARLDAPWTVAALARAAGYAAEWAFSRAFERHHGVAPGVFRRAVLATVTASARPRMALAA